MSRLPALDSVPDCQMASDRDEPGATATCRCARRLSGRLISRVLKAGFLSAGKPAK
jgi:hypothetical protein